MLDVWVLDDGVVVLKFKGECTLGADDVNGATNGNEITGNIILYIDSEVAINVFDIELIVGGNDSGCVVVESTLEFVSNLWWLLLPLAIKVEIVVTFEGK